MKPKTIKILCYVSEAVFGTLAIASAFEHYPFYVAAFMALAKGSAALKDALTKQKQE